MNDSPPLPRKTMLLIAAGQGLALLALYRASDAGLWPSESPLWSYPLWTLALALPLLMLLSLEQGISMRVTKLVAGFGAVLAVLAIYTGWQARPFGEFPLFGLSLAFATTITLACFKALMYLQQVAARVPLTYQVLFTNSWQNFLVTAMSALFVLIFWLILMLWAGLFRMIDVGFFLTLFTADWFLFPVLSFAFGLGVIIFRNLTRVIDNITRLLQALLKLLLPLVVGVAAIFLATLPFVGLDVLWSTTSGTGLLLWLLAIILFFVNAVYQDGRETNPYSPIIHRLIFLGLWVMPFISALSLYGLILRLNQYGWTVQRCWAFAIWLVLSLFAAGYVIGIARRRAEWTFDLARVNTGMGLFVLVLMLLTNSPVLDFRRISLNSQLDRVESGEIELREFDFWYAHQNLARPGYLALEEMKEEVGDSDAELFAKIDNPRPSARAGHLRSPEQMWSQIEYRPQTFEVPPELKAMISRSNITGVAGDPVLLQLDLDADGQNEYLLLQSHEYGFAFSLFYYLTENGWRRGDLRHGAMTHRGEELSEQIKHGGIEVVDPRFKHVEIGDILLKPFATD